MLRDEERTRNPSELPTHQPYTEVSSSPLEEAGMNPKGTGEWTWVYLLASIHSLAGRKILQRTGDFPGREEEAAKLQHGTKRLYIRGPQAPGSNAWWSALELMQWWRNKVPVNVMHLDQPETISWPCRPWKNCLPQNWSLMPKRLGTTAYRVMQHPSFRSMRWLFLP